MLFILGLLFFVEWSLLFSNRSLCCMEYLLTYCKWIIYNKYYFPICLKRYLFCIDCLLLNIVGLCFSYLTFLSEKNTFLSEKNTFLSEKNTFLSEKNTLRSEKNTLRSEEKSILNEKNTIRSEKKTFLSELKTFVNDYQTVLCSSWIVLF